MIKTLSSGFLWPCTALVDVEHVSYSVRFHGRGTFQRVEDLIMVIFVQLVDVPGEWMEVGIEHQVEVGIKI
jgi:hypothetical protein